MVAGYVRLSRDDDKKNYVSIENQKLLISQYAAELGYVIDTWYEDDGVSGYSFNRPGFKKLLEDLDNNISIVIAKDLSRIGRHNAKVLLLLDDFKERGKRLLLVDDDYDTEEDKDDMIGIKTWYNERYVKDTSRKIRKVIRVRQENGTLVSGVPFGYTRDKTDKSKIIIVEEEAGYIRKVFELYLQGYGYRKIAGMLSEQGIPTPSMMINERFLAKGKVSNHKITTAWSQNMVSDILKNDFYIGNLRTHKRSRITINGTDRRVSKEEQILFENNHEAVIDKNTFELVQEMKQKRIRTNYRGQNLEGSIFGGCLFCKDCGSRLTLILRKRNTDRKYYLCSTYNSKGKRYCEYAHLINEADLISDVIHYIKLCCYVLASNIKTYDMNDFIKEKSTNDLKQKRLMDGIDKNKKQLKVLLSRKLNEKILTEENEKLINDTYSELQAEILSRISSYEIQLKELEDSRINSKSREKFKTALQIMEDILDKGNISRKDMEVLIDKIIIDKNGLPEIYLKYGLSGLVKYNPAEELNKHEYQIIITTMKLIQQEERTYTSAKYLSEELTKLGFKICKNAVLTYIRIMSDMGILKSTENRLKPYQIMVSKKELEDRIKIYMESMSNWWYAADGIRIYSEEKRNRSEDRFKHYTEY